MIPNNITKEHIVSAINDIEKNGYPIIREPSKYYIKYKEKTYPAKYIISLSNKFANGQELLFNDFIEGTETNEFLKSRGFELITENKLHLNSRDEKFDLEKIILEYDKNKDFLGKRKITEHEAMELRSKFITDFPLETILNLKLERYVFGIINNESGTLDESTFCFKIEYRMQGFGGIRGSPANKFGIYFDRKKQKYVYDENKFSSPDESFKKIITEINYLLQSGKQFSSDSNWDKMSQIFEKEYEIQTHVKSKILSVYFPESFALIHSNKRIKRILIDLFNIPQEETKNELLLNHARLLEIKQNHPIMEKWSNFDYSTFVWRVSEEYFDNSNNLSDTEEKLDNNNQLKTGFWLVRAGSKGEKEKDILENNIITISWSAGDLSQFNDKDNLKKEFSRLNPNQTKRSVETISAELWKFAKVIKKGDIAILPQKAKGSNHNIAIAKVIDDYRYREDLPEIKNRIPVIWLHKNIPIHEFANDAKESFGKQLTVSRISKPFAIQSIIDTMKKYKILPKELQELPNGKKTELSINDKEGTYTLESLSEFLCMPIEKLRTIEELLEEKKQIIFYGPPGTSKTYVAKKFSKYFTQNTENIEIVQFHPSYSYEDFIEGIKPKMSNTDKTTVGFEKKEGLFKHIVKKCLENPNEKFVLIIDEINRGNISKIFGELIYLLEYRNKDESIHLTYSPNEKFYIPDNLYIIATMNSADRSIAFVDYALRRRFYFIDFYPNSNLEILSKWIKKNYNGNEINPSIIVNLLNELNAIIDDRLGREFEIGYSYFMRKNLSLKHLERIKEYAIMPLIQQYFFGKKKSIEDIQTIFDKYLNANNEIVSSERLNI